MWPTYEGNVTKVKVKGDPGKQETARFMKRGKLFFMYFLSKFMMYLLIMRRKFTFRMCCLLLHYLLH